MNNRASDLVRFGPFEADLRTQEIKKDGTKLKLVGQPFEILAALLRKPGELVTRQELRARLWPADTFVNFDHGLNAAIKKLREVLCDSAEEPRYVQTLPRRGYRFIAKVESVGAAESARSIGAIEPTANISSVLVGVPEVALSASGPRHLRVESPWLGFRYLLGLAALFALLVGATVVLKIRSTGAMGSGNAVAQRIHLLTSSASAVGEPAFSADGNLVAFRRRGVGEEESGLFVRSASTDGDSGTALVQLTKDADDCCPVWSPDGREIAFTRGHDEHLEIFVVPSGGGRERKLELAGITPKRGELDWSPDGRSIAFSAGGIFVYSLTGAAVRRLTEPPSPAEDWEPVFSPDGGKILFVRSGAAGTPEEILSVPTRGGEATRILSEPAGFDGPAQWSSDGRSVIFASFRSGHPALWRVSLDARDEPIELIDGGWRPAVSRKGYRLAYQRVARSLHIWKKEISDEDGQREAKAQILVANTSQTDQGPGPQFSPDGKKLAYMSDRSGTMEIWISDHAGAHAFQLTAVGGAGTPRWSPDSQSVVFDVTGRDSVAIYVASLKGGSARALVEDGFANVCPSWSRDSKWIYFASKRTGVWQVWRIKPEGGTPMQVTTQGGHAAIESVDGEYLYYAKTMYADPEIWQMPTGGGTETRVSPLVRPSTWASWAVTDHGIIFATASGTGEPVLELFDIRRRRLKKIGVLDTVPFWLSATRDGNTVVFDKPGWQQPQIMIAENFR